MPQDFEMETALEQKKKVPARLLIKHLENRGCYGPNRQVIGLLEDIDVEDKSYHWIWVENEKVLFFFRTPMCPAEYTRRKICRDIDGAFEDARLDKYVTYAGGNRYVQNQLAGNAVFPKAPQYAIGLKDKFKGTQKCPIFVVEFAGLDESVYHLLCESAVWLNSRTDTVYCLAVEQITYDDRYFHFYLLERTAPFPSESEFLPDYVKKKRSNVLCTEEEALALSKKQPRNPEVKFDPDDLTSHERIEARYHVKVLSEHIIKPRDATNITLQCDLTKMLARSSIPSKVYKNRTLSIDMSEIIRYGLSNCVFLVHIRHVTTSDEEESPEKYI